MKTIKVLLPSLLLLFLPPGAYATQSGRTQMNASATTLRIFSGTTPQTILLTITVDGFCAPGLTFTITANGEAIDTLGGLTPVSETFHLLSVKQTSVSLSAPVAGCFVSWQIDTH
jgi:hypothetical protein